jgi:hypothetical protein
MFIDASDSVLNKDLSGIKGFIFNEVEDHKPRESPIKKEKVIDKTSTTPKKEVFADTTKNY